MEPKTYTGQQSTHYQHKQEVLLGKNFPVMSVSSVCDPKQTCTRDNATLIIAR